MEACLVEDAIWVGTKEGSHVVIYAAYTRALVEELRVRHDTWPVVTAAMGRVATLAAMMTMSLKNPEHQITLQVQGDGPIGKVYMVATGEGTVRGYVNEPHVELPLNALGKLAVGAAVGQEGYVSVMRDLGLKEPYQGSVPLVSGEIGEDFTYYFAVSEQVPTAVAVGVLVERDYSVRAAGGLMIHILPGASDAEIAAVEAGVAELPNVTTLLDAGESPQQIAARVMGDGVHWTEQRSVRFACTCNRARLEQVLLALGREELEAMIEEQGEAELVCHFCGERYDFSETELRGLRDAALH